MNNWQFGLALFYAFAIGTYTGLWLSEWRANRKQRRIKRLAKLMDGCGAEDMLNAFALSGQWNATLAPTPSTPDNSTPL